MTKIKTRPDPDGEKTIGEIIKEVEALERIQAYLNGVDEYGMPSV